MKNYDPKRIEAKWQRVWEKERFSRAADFSKKKKNYLLVEFPYPSGEGLHVGHIRGYTAMDVVARKRRAEGYNVLYPMGWDAFGLPTENYAIKTGRAPSLITRQNINRYRRQLLSLGFSFDWSREVNTSDPDYYKWTQWIFLQMFKRGLAYKARSPINWCPQDKIGLANEEVVDGHCERCGVPVEQREKEQWMLAITKYADRLDRDLNSVDYPEPIKTQQRNWIGRKEGAVISFQVLGHGGQLAVFTTRPETIFGATFIAVTGKADRFTGRYAVNPANAEKIPIWEAEYVMVDVGTGTVMGVPAHDERDRDFAQKHDLPIKDAPLVDRQSLKKIGDRPMTTYKLRDWVFSRQRYWGEPIPLVFCQKCQKWQPVPEEDLPVKLPNVKGYKPTDTGESPLAKMEKWIKTKCSVCHGPARRETDVMPNWAGSSWYYLRYCDPKNSGELASSKKLKYWLGVDWYNGGMEHTTLHLLYSRFWHKFLYDIGAAPTSEPYLRRSSHGLILAAGGEKMSKSRGNVINPDDIVERFGADALRVYEMFMGPFDQAIVWSADGLVGARRFLERVWKLKLKLKTRNSKSRSKNQKLEILKNQTVKKVGEDTEQMKFNTAVSQLMILLNGLEAEETVARSDYEVFLKLLAPFAPHLAEEIWRTSLKRPISIHRSPWPVYDTTRLQNQEATIVVQVNGVTRDRFIVPPDLSEEEVKRLAADRVKIARRLRGRRFKKTIYLKGKLINFVVE